MNPGYLMLVLSLTLCSSIQSRMSPNMSDSLDTRLGHISKSLRDDIKSFCERDVESFRTDLDFPAPSKEDRAKIQRAADALAKITHEIKEDDSTVNIIFKGFAGLAKDQVKVVHTNGCWSGTITLPEGSIGIFISSAEVRVTFKVELKKEEETSSKNQPSNQFENSYYSRSTATSRPFTSSVDVNSLAGEVKPTECTLTMKKHKTVARKKDEVLILS